MAAFAKAVGQHDYSGAVKLLDAEITETQSNYAAAMHRLVQLQLNRGICNQKLSLNRKALKDFDAVLALAPGCVKALLHKGQVLQALGKSTEARAELERAASLADPTSDLDTILQIDNALSALGSSITAVPAPAAAQAAYVAPIPPAPPAATALTPVTPKAGASAGGGSGDGGAVLSAAPQPQKTAEAGIAAPHANGVIAAGQTQLSSSAKQPAVAASEDTKSGGKPQQSNKAFKGFLKPVPGSSSSSKSSASGGSNTSTSSSNGTPTASSTSPKSSPKSSSSKSGANGSDVVDIDCAAEQQRKHKKQQQQGAAPASFGERVAQQQQNSVMLTIAINQINSGQVEAAEQLLDKLLAANPNDLSALVARGTARAMNRNLKGADEDFTHAIQLEPRYADTYKRRGQARSAMGNMQGALDDLDMARKLLEAPEDAGLAGLLNRSRGEADDRNTVADCYSERGMLLQKMKDYRKAVRELTQAAAKDPKNAQIWNYLGLARVSMGDIRDGCKAYQKALELDPSMREAWLNLGQACKEEARVDEADKALCKALKNADGTPCLPAYRLLATMRQGAGRQAEAIVLCDKALSFKKESIELLYLRAICHHALGYVRKALADYDACMNVVPAPEMDVGPLAEEARMFQFLCYYQREIALWMFHNLDTRSADICLDTELAAAFKEGWCKKCCPDARIFQSYKHQPGLPADDAAHTTGSSSSSSTSGSKRGSSTATSPRTSSSACGSSSSSSATTNTGAGSSGRGGSRGGSESPTPCLEAAEVAAAAEQVAALTAAADTLGNLLQNHHQGFLPNVRQQRAAGYAALELAQAVRALLAERAAGRDGLWVNSEGSSGQGGCSGRHLFGWRDAMDIVVKWRQLAEPADQVVWVDLLTKEEFENGFGSHTPMFSGQTKCVRYYMNFERALALAKECLLKLGHAYDAQNREVALGGDHKADEVKGAETALELYNVIGQDSWVVVPLHSILKHQQKDSSSSNGAPSTSPAASPAAANGNTSTSSSSKAATKSSSGSSSTKSSSSSSSSSRPGSSGGRARGVQPVVVPDGCLEGTRLTLVNVPNQPDAVEFSIRTPVTPPRWKEFDAELEAGWERIIAALLSGDKHTIATAIMCYAYYWYNFMPLARGTAAVGYTTMLGLFWAAGMPVTNTIPKDYQVDWEAILATHPQQFIDRLSEWFVPAAALPCAPIPGSTSSGNSNGSENTTSAAAAAPASPPKDSGSNGGSSGSSGGVQMPEVEAMPKVDEVLATFRQRLNALNGPAAKPV